MIDGNSFLKKVSEYFSFLIDEHNFRIIEEKVTGNFFYSLRYGNKINVVSISYENSEEYFQVVIFTLKNGKLPNYDDKTRTLHLNKINQAIFSIIEKNDIESNSEYFLQFVPIEDIDKMLLKSAKELRLYFRYAKE